MDEKAITIQTTLDKVFQKYKALLRHILKSNCTLTLRVQFNDFLIFVNLPSHTTIITQNFKNVSFTSLKSFMFVNCYSRSPQIPPQATNYLSVSTDFPFMDILYKSNHMKCSLCVCLLSLSIMVLRFIPVIACISNSFVFIAE